MPNKLRLPLSATSLISIWATALLGGCLSKAGLPEQQADGAFPNLPSPASLARAASAPPADSDRLRLGAEWDASLPNNLAAGDMLSPAYAGGAGRDLGDAAYVCFRFANLDEYTGPASVELQWGSGGDIAQDVYLGLANFSKNVWDWEKFPANWQINVASFDDYADPSGQSIAVILSLDNGTFQMDYVLAGSNTLPVIDLTTDLDPDPTQNIAPRPVSFNALGTRSYGGSIVGFDFDWDGNGSWDELGDPDGLGIHLYQAGNYNFKIRATDNLGQSAIASVSFAIIDPNNMPPIPDLSPSPPAGDGPLTVLLNAEGSSDPDGYLIKYEWDIFADGSWDIEQETPDASYVFAIAGANPVTLRVTDNFYATSTDTANVTLNKGWHSNNIDPGTDIRYRISTCTTDSGSGPRACVAYQDFTTQELMFARASDEGASAWSSPISPVNSPNNSGLNPDIAVLVPSGIPIISYGESTTGNPLYVVRGADETGASWQAPVTVAASGRYGGTSSIAVINSIPCIAAYDGLLPQGQQKVVFFTSQNALGSGWNAPIDAIAPIPGTYFHALSLGSTGAAGFKRPLIAVSALLNQSEDRIYVSAATNPDGTAWLSPSSYSAWRYEFDLALANSKPVLCFSGAGSSPGCYFLRANDGNASSWPAAPLSLSSTSTALDVVLRGTKPFVCYQDLPGNRLMCREALDDDGTTWAEPYILWRGAGVDGCHLDMTMAGNWPVICYMFSTGFEFDLKSLSYY